MISIDQNCHSLWDVIPKLAALNAHGHKVQHFIEDIDVAFTSMGASVGNDTLRMARERFHRSGGQDWGAAMFYSEFLGRLPVEIRDWEPFTGLKTNVLAKQLDETVDNIYDELSPSDNWQLVGPSYVGDKQHHRVVADLTTAETSEFLREMLNKAKLDTLQAFPQNNSQQRISQWFSREEKLLEQLIADASAGQLVDVYREWLKKYMGDAVNVSLTSELFACKSRPRGFELLEMFCKDYEQLAGLYNSALAESNAALRPLNDSSGELPFFATYEYEGHMVRSGLWLDGNELRIADKTFCLSADGSVDCERLSEAGIGAIAGKAVVLVIQARIGDGAQPLALPYQGSLYMPAAEVFLSKLIDSGLIKGAIRPIVRVRFNLLDKIKSLDTTIHLPQHLAGYFCSEEISAKEFGENYAAISAQSQKQLQSFKEAPARLDWQKQNFPGLFAKIDLLDNQRRKLAKDNPKSPEVRDVWKQIKSLQTILLDKTLRQIAYDWQMSQIDYWDTRGAIIPWSIALGGEKFYNKIIDEAEIYQEPLSKGLSE